MPQPYRGFARTASKEVQLHGQTILPNEPITMVRCSSPVSPARRPTNIQKCYASANRDPDQFPDPEKFVLHRANITSHLGFGRGRHRCVGMPLARLAMQTAVQVLLRKTKDFEVCGEIEYARMPEVGITSCPLRFELAD